MGRYLVNDDDIDEWIKILEEVKESIGECPADDSVQYVIDQMKQFIKEYEYPAPMPKLKVSKRFDLFLADFKAKLGK
jgi:hypothetical protein